MKKRKAVLPLLLFSAIVATQLPVAAEEQNMQVSMNVQDSYIVYIPQSVVIVPPTDYKVDGGDGILGSADGAEIVITAVTNTIPGHAVKVSVKKDSFNDAGTGLTLTEKQNPNLILTTNLGVRDNGSDEKYTPVTKEENTVAVFSGKTGAANAAVSGGSLHFSAPKEKEQSSGEYSGSLVFEVTYVEQ